jgi:hypothetical protein
MGLEKDSDCSVGLEKAFLYNLYWELGDLVVGYNLGPGLDLDYNEGRERAKKVMVMVKEMVENLRRRLGCNVGHEFAPQRFDNLKSKKENT